MPRPSAVPPHQTASPPSSSDPPTIEPGCEVLRKRSTSHPDCEGGGWGERYGEGTFDRPYEPFHRGGLNQMRARTDDGRTGTAIDEVTGSRHHRYFPDTTVRGSLPS